MSVCAECVQRTEDFDTERDWKYAPPDSLAGHARRFLGSAESHFAEQRRVEALVEALIEAKRLVPMPRIPDERTASGQKHVYRRQRAWHETVDVLLAEREAKR